MRALESSAFLTSCAVTMLAVACMLVAEARAAKVLRAVSKSFAALGFLAAALSAGLPATRAGTITLFALVFCAVGDLLLLFDGASRAFLLGLTAFLVGHVGFLAAFVTDGVSWSASGLALLALAPVVFFVMRWLLPHVGTSMKLPVLAYVAVITLMVASAVGSFAQGGSVLGLLAATAFFASDFSVARGRFVSDTLINKLWGTPLYFGAQLVFAAWMLR